MKTIYRLEYYGRGIYRSTPKNYTLRFYIKDMACEHSKKSHPGLYNDFPEKITKPLNDYYCAFNDINSLKKWFGKHLDYLLQHKYVKIKQLIVKDCLVSKSKKQIFYKKEDIIKKRIYEQR
jgi:tryptophan synthase beta subunit